MVSFVEDKSGRSGNLRGLLVAFIDATVLTALGFFWPGVWLWLAYVPFALALLQRGGVARRAAFAAGHFAVVFAIAATGLVNLGHAPALVVLGYIAALGMTAALYGYLGVGVAAVICALVPYFPGSPLLIAGALFPDWGFLGLAGLAVLAMGLGAIPLYPRRILTIVLVGPAILFAHFGDGSASGKFLGVGVKQEAGQVASDSKWQTQTLEADGQTPALWALLGALRSLPEGTSVITGENIVLATDEVGLRDLCRAARAQGLDLYAGVEGRDGAGELWQINAKTCPEPKRLYRAAVGIPGLTGDWASSPTGWSDVGPSQLPSANGTEVQADQIGLLACFEAFSIQAWMRAASASPAVFVNFSNDHWTDPLPVAILRAKVAAQFGALYGAPVLHTDRDNTILVKYPEKEVSDAP